jgi:hypothetical protein
LRFRFYFAYQIGFSETSKHFAMNHACKHYG